MNKIFDESSGGSEHLSASEAQTFGQSDSGLLGTFGAEGAPQRQRVLLALAALTAALLALMLSALLGHLLWPSSSGSAAGTPLSGASVVAAASGSPADVSAIAAKIDPGLVDVNTNLTYEGAVGAGTGIVLAPNGEVLTNNHVVEGATRISVTDIGNGKTYSATVVGYDPSKDVALLQLRDASGLQTASIGNSASASVGESIVGIGNAGGTGGAPSAAAGSITALHQSISAADQLTDSTEQLTSLIEINADIQPGDSGGALANGAGQVIGMDTAGSSSGGYFSFQGEASSQAYAIPIDAALAVAKEIEAGHGSTTVHVGATAFIGIGVKPTESASSGFGYGGYGQTSTVNGLEVFSVVSGMPGPKAGLVVGDVVTAFNGHTLTTENELTDQLLVLHPGATAKITWTDTSGTSHSSIVTLASGPAA
jgi:S1-C subfamily serine protease